MIGIEYTIKVADFLNPNDVIPEMLRYSGSQVIERISEREFKLVHEINERKEKFFYSHIKPRWEDFGAEVTVVCKRKITEEELLEALKP